MYDSLWPHEIRLPYPSLSPWVCSNSCPLSQWCHPTISSSVTSFSCPQSFPASGSFPKNWLFASGGQSIGVSFSFSISPSNECSGFISFRIDWFDLLAIQGTLKSLLQHHSSKTSILWHSAFFMIKLLHLNATTGKAIALTIWTIDGKVTFCFLIWLSRFVIALLPRSKHLLFHVCSHCLQWFWSQRKENLSLFPFFPHLFA